jgi:hypothetical protein
MAEPVPSTAPPPRRQRPVGVVLIAAFLIADAALAIAGHLFDLQTGTRQDLLAAPDEQAALVVIGLVILRVIAAIGLWFGWRRGWVLTMLLVGISLILDLWLYFDGRPYYVRMAFDVILAFYLNQGAVREYFGRSAARRTTSTVRAVEDA